MNCLALLLFIASLLDNRLSANFGPNSLSQDPTKAGKKWLDADPGQEGRIVGGEQAGMKDAPWQVCVIPSIKCSTLSVTQHHDVVSQ